MLALGSETRETIQGKVCAEERLDPAAAGTHRGNAAPYFSGKCVSAQTLKEGFGSQEVIPA